MMRCKTADRRIDRTFDIGSTLVDGSPFALGQGGLRPGERHVDFLKLIQALENRRICCKRNKPRLLRPASIVGSLNPLHCGLDARRRNALRNIEQICDRQPYAGPVDDRLHQCESQQCHYRRAQRCRQLEVLCGQIRERLPLDPPEVGNGQQEEQRPVYVKGESHSSGKEPPIPRMTPIRFASLA